MSATHSARRRRRHEPPGASARRSGLCEIADQALEQWLAPPKAVTLGKLRERLEAAPSVLELRESRLRMAEHTVALTMQWQIGQSTGGGSPKVPARPRAVGTSASH
jgi:hypothetical protein